MNIYSHKFIKIKQVAEMTSLSEPSIYRLQKEGKFPKSVKIAGNTTRWVHREIEEYLNACLANRN
jgi:prophage regulatory protein